MKYYAKVYEGLIDPKHYQQMGPAIWLYTLLLMRETYGPVKRGFVASDVELAECIGCRERIIRDWRKRLLKYGYITATRHSRGYSYAVTKSKKFTNGAVEDDSSGRQKNVNQTDSSDRHKNVNHSDAVIGTFSSCDRHFFVTKSPQPIDDGVLTSPNKVIKEDQPQNPTPEESSAALKAEEDSSAMNPKDQNPYRPVGLTTRAAEERGARGLSCFSSPSDGGKSPRSICAAELKRQMRSKGRHKRHS